MRPVIPVGANAGLSGDLLERAKALRLFSPRAASLMLDLSTSNPMDPQATDNHEELFPLSLYETLGTLEFNIICFLLY